MSGIVVALASGFIWQIGASSASGASSEIVVAFASGFIVGTVVGGFVIWSRMRNAWKHAIRRVPKKVRRRLVDGVTSALDLHETEQRPTPTLDPAIVRDAMVRVGSEFEPPVVPPPGDLDGDGIESFMVELIRAKKRELGRNLVDVAGDQAKILREHIASGRTREASEALERLLSLISRLTGVSWTGRVGDDEAQ
jgi:hypothetical protein